MYNLKFTTQKKKKKDRLSQFKTSVQVNAEKHLRQLPGRGVPPFGHTGRGGVVVGHTLNTQTLTNTDERKKGGKRKLTIWCWTTFIAILGRMRPLGCGSDTSGLTLELILEVKRPENDSDFWRKPETLTGTCVKKNYLGETTHGCFSPSLSPTLPPLDK